LRLNDPGYNVVRRIEPRCTLTGWIRAIELVILLGSNALAQDITPADRSKSAIEGLRAKDVAARRGAANQVRLAAREVQREALPVLIDLLMKEKDGQVRLAVLDAVTSLGPEAEPAVPALLHTLKTSYGGQGQEESHQDYRSALALAAIGKPAVEGLRSLLKERKENVRAEVVMALGRIGPEASSAVPDLVPLLGDASVRIRREASRTLGLIGPAAIEPLIASSKSGDIVIREGAIEAFGSIPSPDARANQTVMDRAHDQAPGVRVAALRSLARLGLPEDSLLPIVREALRDDDERVRLAVVKLLETRPGLRTRMAPDFESLLTTGSDGVARLAAFLLGRSGLEAAPRLLGALRRNGSRVDSIAEGLAQIGRPAVALLSKAIEDPEPRVRQGAALALGQIRPLPSGISQKLASGLADPNSDVRSAFLTAIGHLGPKAVGSVEAVRGLLADGSPEIRARAIEVLSQSAPRDEALLGDLGPLVDDPEPKVQARAINALRALGPPGQKVLPAVIRRLESPDAEVRLAAVQMVESHGLEAVQAIPSLITLLRDPTPKIRSIAATTLGRFGKAAQPALPSLTTLLGDEDPAIREAVLSTIGSLELDAQTVRPYLARGLRDDKAEVRRAATRAVPRLGPEGVLLVPDIILMAARKENARSVDRLLRPFERTGPDSRSLPELVKCLDHDQVAVKLLAIKFLGLAGKNASEALPALERIREDPSAEVRQQAKNAAEKIQGDAGSKAKDQAGNNLPSSNK
jgi:HEAT repeat protein